MQGTISQSTQNTRHNVEVSKQAVVGARCLRGPRAWTQVTCSKLFIILPVDMCFATTSYQLLADRFKDGLWQHFQLSQLSLRKANDASKSVRQLCSLTKRQSMNLDKKVRGMTVLGLHFFVHVNTFKFCQCHSTLATTLSYLSDSMQVLRRQHQAQTAVQATLGPSNGTLCPLWKIWKRTNQMPSSF